MSLTHGMWAECHRPRNLDECVLELLSPEEETFIRGVAAASILPNLLFHGPPGTGKTSVARILCSDEKYHICHFNGSLIDKEVVGNEISGAALGNRTLYHDLRVVFIDEVDGLTPKSQLALRALMEKDGVDTAWVMTCNVKSSLIDPILSRLISIEFSYPPAGNSRERHLQGVVRRCEQILETERIFGIQSHELRKIVERHYPDTRRIVNALQMGYGFRRAA